MRALLVLVSAALTVALVPPAAATAATPHLVGRVESAHQSAATNVIAVDPQAFKREFAQEMGATHSVADGGETTNGMRALIVF
jgi:Zn-dependent alcohol dehydrogenase